MKSLLYILFEKNVFIFQRWKWPAQGTSTVPVVSAHCRPLRGRTDLSGGRLAVFIGRRMLLRLVRGDVSVVVMVTLHQRTAGHHPNRFHLIKHRQSLHSTICRSILDDARQ